MASSISPNLPNLTTLSNSSPVLAEFMNAGYINPIKGFLTDKQSDFLFRSRCWSLPAGEALTAGDAVRVHTDGKLYKTNASTSAGIINFIGFSNTTTAADAQAIFSFDFVVGLSAIMGNLSIGATYYASNTAGLITTTKPSSNILQVGVALDANTIAITHSPSGYPQSVYGDTTPVAYGGTGANNASAARENLGIGGGAIAGFSSIGIASTVSGITATQFYSSVTFSGVTYTNLVICTTSTPNPYVLNDSISFSGQTGNHAVLNGTWGVDYWVSSTTFGFQISSAPSGAFPGTSISAQRLPIITKSKNIRGILSTSSYYVVYFRTPVVDPYSIVATAGDISNFARIVSYYQVTAASFTLGNNGVSNAYSGTAYEQLSAVVYQW